MSDQVVVRCPSCSQKYRLSVPSVGRRARCKKCNAKFIINPEQPVDEDIVVSWITDDDPSSQSVMGSTGIFQNSAPTTVSRTERSPRGDHSSDLYSQRASLGVKLIKIDDTGAHFEFPVATLASEDLRNSFPRKCVGCGTRTRLQIHLIYWPERMTAHDVVHWEERARTVVGKLEAFSKISDKMLLKHLPKSRHMPRPFSLPFPVFACEYCDVVKEVQAHILNRGGAEICCLMVAYLSVAVDFFRHAGGRHTPEYHRLVEERDLRQDAWRQLDPKTKYRISKWFEPQAGERFVRFFRSLEFSSSENGTGGIVLTSNRMVFKKYAAFRDYPLDQNTRIEIMPKGSQATVRIYREGQRSAVFQLKRAAADELAGSLQKLRCHWAVVS
ncbi:MAG: hypothetical protein JSV03_13750 [Planctomycetota bacterium]|nr:MAG: hypothetical protein JSV03_13750 [Planctomycetota bacterium]